MNEASERQRQTDSLFSISHAEAQKLFYKENFIYIGAYTVKLLPIRMVSPTAAAALLIATSTTQFCHLDKRF